MLIRLYKSRFFIVFTFLILAILLYNLIMISIWEITRAFSPKYPLSQLSWFYNLMVSGFTLILVGLFSISIYGIRKSKRINNTEYVLGFYITTLITLMAFIGFTCVIIFNL
jgi:hypothetical protein